MTSRSIVLLGVLAYAIPAQAQIFLTQESFERSRHEWFADFGAQYAQPVGAFRSHVERAWGFGGSARYGIPKLGPLGVRVDGAFFNYGNERKRVPLSATVNRVIVDQNTSNNIALATLGPELAIRRGPLQPYVYAFAGVSYLF